MAFRAPLRGILLMTLACLSGRSEPSAKPSEAAFRRLHRPAINPALTAPFLPALIVPEDSGQIVSFKRLAGGFRQDSTHFYSIRKGRLHVSYDLLQEMAAGELPNTGRGLGGRLADFLGRKHGLRFHSSGNAYGSYTPNDEWYAQWPQWALHNDGRTIADRPGKAGVDIDIEKVWDKFGGSDSLVIAVIDAGFDFQHPDLKGKNWVNAAEAGGKPGVDDDGNGFVDDSLGWDFVDSDNYPEDFQGHGTFCSSVIAAGFDNAAGIAGAVPQCRIMPIRVLDASGHGAQDDIAQGVLYAINNGAKVINFSIGGDRDNANMRNAFQAARDKGVPIIVAAGNDGLDIDATPVYPASYTFDNMLVVAAHDHAGLLCGFSNYGKTGVDLAAPGEQVLVAGTPDPKEIWNEGFESATPVGWNLGAPNFALSSVNPIDGTQSLAWTSGTSVAATTTGYIDLTGWQGCAFRMRLDYHPANGYDVLIIEGNAENTSTWNEIGIIGSDSDPNFIQSFGLQDFDGTRFKLRFRTSGRLTSSGRRLRIDGLQITAHDPNPADQAIYSILAGTSIAAPHVTAYVGLQRVACERMGLAWSRNLALNGVVAEAAFAGKVATGGRLDVYKGLEFYLSTLPDFHFMDSTALTWRVGEEAHYALKLDPVPVPTYTFSVSGLGDGATVDGAGNLVWLPGLSDIGPHTATLTAQGPTLLRKRFEVSVEPGDTSGVVVGSGVRSPGTALWRLGNEEFQVRPDMAAGRHRVEVWGSDMAGKVQLLKEGWFDASEFRQPWNFPLASRFIARIQVQIDGRPLVHAP